MLSLKLENYLEYRQSDLSCCFHETGQVQYLQPLTSDPSMCNQFRIKRDINNTLELGIHQKEGTAVYVHV